MNSSINLLTGLYRARLPFVRLQVRVRNTLYDGRSITINIMKTNVFYDGRSTIIKYVSCLVCSDELYCTCMCTYEFENELADMFIPRLLAFVRLQVRVGIQAKHEPASSELLRQRFRDSAHDRLRS